MSISNITSGFKVTGIYPTDHQAILKLIPDSHSCIQEESGLAFIPLISPSIKSKCSKSSEATIAKEVSPSGMSKSGKQQVQKTSLLFLRSGIKQILILPQMIDIMHGLKKITLMMCGCEAPLFYWS